MEFHHQGLGTQGTCSDPGHCSLGTQAYSGSRGVTSALVTIPEGSRVSIFFSTFLGYNFFLIYF